MTAGGGVSGDVGRAGIQGTGLRWWLQSGERMPSEEGVGGAEPLVTGRLGLRARLRLKVRALLSGVRQTALHPADLFN